MKTDILSQRSVQPKTTNQLKQSRALVKVVRSNKLKAIIHSCDTKKKTDNEISA